MAKKKAKATAKAPPKKRQPKLPGMEDTHIQDLDDAAVSYVNARDERMKLTEVEVERRDEVQTLMHKHGKKTYRCEGVEIVLQPEGEKVKVRVKKDAADVDGQ